MNLIRMKQTRVFISVIAGILIFVGGCKDKESIVDTQSNSLIDITSQQQFDQQLESGVAMIFFHASWCSKCAAQRPAVETVSEDKSFTEVFFGEVEYEDFPNIVKDRGVQGFPTIIIYKDNAEQKRLTGQGHSTADIQAALDAVK